MRMMTNRYRDELAIKSCREVVDLEVLKSDTASSSLMSKVLLLQRLLKRSYSHCSRVSMYDETVRT